MALKLNPLTLAALGGIGYLLLSSGDSDEPPPLPQPRPRPLRPPTPPPAPKPAPKPAPAPAPGPLPTPEPVPELGELLTEYSVNAEVTANAAGAAQMIHDVNAGYSAAAFASERAAAGFDVYVESGITNLPEYATLRWDFPGSAPPGGYILVAEGVPGGWEPPWDDAKGGLVFY